MDIESLWFHEWNVYEVGFRFICDIVEDINQNYILGLQVWFRPLDWIIIWHFKNVEKEGT